MSRDRARAWLFALMVLPAGCSFAISDVGLSGGSGITGGGDAASKGDASPVDGDIGDGDRDRDAEASDAGTRDADAAAPDVAATVDATGSDCGPFTVAGTSSLVDDFSSGSLSPHWSTAQTCTSVVGGELVAQPEPDLVSYCVAFTQRFHLTCDSVTVRVKQVMEPTLGAQTLIYVSGATKTLVLFVEAGGFVLGVQNGPSFTVNPGAYSPTNDLWWRLRESAGMLYFETSPDGTAWTLRSRVPDPFPLDDVSITLGAGAYKALAVPGKARFDCYNGAPSCP